MNLLVENIQYFFDNRLLIEMANLQPSDTGLKPVINIVSKGGAKHGARVKVSNIAGTFHHTDNFSLTLEPEPRVIGSCKIKKEHLEDIKDWVALNRDHLVKVWHHGDSMSIHDVANGFKKL